MSAQTWMTILETADYLRVSVGYIRAKVRTGVLIANRVPGSRIIRISRLQADLFMLYGQSSKRITRPQKEAAADLHTMVK